MSDGKSEKPQPKSTSERAPALARKISEYQGESRDGARGFSALHAHKQQYIRGVEYRFSDGEHGEPPLANLASTRGAPVREFVGREQTGRAMRKAAGEPSQPAVPKTSGSALPTDVKARMEPRLGTDLSGVKIHTGGESAKAAAGFGARAFTVGSDVHFNAGEFAPGTKEGDRLLAHELTHVVQGQRSGIQRKAEDDANDGHADGDAQKAEVSDPGEPAEKEADAVADTVADDLHGDDKKQKDGKQKGDKKNAHAGESKAEESKPDEKGAAAKEQPSKIAAKLQSTSSGPAKIFRATGANSSSSNSASPTPQAQTPAPSPVATPGTMKDQPKQLVAEPAAKQVKLDGQDAIQQVTAAQAALPPAQDPRTPKAGPKLAAMKAQLEQIRTAMNGGTAPATSQLEALSRAVMAAITEYGREFDVSSFGQHLPDFPSPHPCLYGEGDPDAAKVPDKSTRRCHHVPPVRLARSIADQMRSASNDMKDVDGEKRVLTPAGVKVRAAATAVDNFGHGKDMSAIWLHQTTHSNDEGPGVHQSTIAPEVKRRVEAVSDKAEADRFLIVNQDETLSVNPRTGNFKTFLDQIKVRATQIVNEREKQKQLDAVKKAEDADKAITATAQTSASEIARQVLKEQIRLAFDNALAQTSTQVATALSASFVDGDRAAHGGKIAELRGKAQSSWAPIVNAAD